MGDNTLGNRFKITSFGESHGEVVGIVIDGIPAGLDINMDFIQSELDKRRPGQSNLATNRSEPDKVKVISGIFNNMTTGAPLCLIIKNKDVDSSKYEEFKNILRPSQVDYIALKKYGGFADYRGSGRFSGRITASFVMAGAIAKQILEKKKVTVFAFTKSIGNIIDENHYDFDDLTQYIQMRENSFVRSLNPEKSLEMENLIENVKSQNDSIGGIIKCIVKDFPVGVGGPIFNSLESKISHAIFSIPGVKGIEFGAGFKATKMKGSEHNDPWFVEKGIIKAQKNDSGGIIGGISTGMPIVFNVAIKPTATIGKIQKTVNVKKMENIEYKFSGRHDACIVPRAIVVVEAMTAIVLLDFLLTEGWVSPIIDT